MIVRLSKEALAGPRPLPDCTAALTVTVSSSSSAITNADEATQVLNSKLGCYIASQQSSRRDMDITWEVAADCAAAVYDSLAHDANKKLQVRQAGWGSMQAE